MMALPLPPSLSSINVKLAQWGGKLLDPSVHIAGILSTAPFPLAGTFAPGTPRAFNGSNVVTSMDPYLILTLLEQKDGAVPPLALVVDTRTAGAARTATVTFSAEVAGWTPLVGDADAGFSSCNKMVLGPVARLALQPGEGELFALSVYSDAQEAAPTRVREIRAAYRAAA